MSNVHVIKCAHCKGRHATAYDVHQCSLRANSPFGPVRAGIVASARSQVAPQPRPNEWSLSTPRNIIESMRDGRYAVQLDDSRPFVFVRVSRPKHGKRKGQLLVQTQHSDWYKPLITIYPTGSVWIDSRAAKIGTELTIIAVDPVTCAINYGRELGVCSRCGRELTDERSRYYTIGPECEKSWPEIITAINDSKGVYHA